MDIKQISLLIKDYFPETVIDFVAKQIISYNLRLIISRKRLSRLGVFRPSKISKRHVISVNGDLDKNLFFLVYLHELAHLIVWNNYNRRVAPHGKEWKEEFRKIIINSLNLNHFDEETKLYVINCLKKPNFHRAITREMYESDKENLQSDLMRLKNIPENSTFTLSNGRTFKIINKIRTRYRCLDIKNGKYYLVSSQAEVVDFKE